MGALHKPEGTRHGSGTGRGQWGAVGSTSATTVPPYGCGGLCPPTLRSEGFCSMVFPILMGEFILKLAYVNQFVQYGAGKVRASAYFIYIDVGFCGKIVVYRF